MAFEETLVCDGCSRVIDGGSREMTLRTLRDQEGRAFARDRRSGGWTEIGPAERWGLTTRHLCGRCADQTEFFDGEAVPPALADSGTGA